MDTIRAEFQDLLGRVVHDVVNALPGLVATVLLFLVALVVAKGAERITRLLLRRTGLGRAFARAGVDDWLQRLGVTSALTEVIPRVVYWVLLLLFVRSVADALGLLAISEAVGGVIGYLPEVTGALLIMVAGSFLARFAGAAVENAAREAGMDYAPGLGRGVSAVVLVLLGVMAASQLRIDTAVIQITAGVVLLALGLGFALSFGLGGRDVTRTLIAGHYARRSLQVGAAIRIGEVDGVLVGIGATHLLVEREGRLVRVPNDAFLTGAVEQ